MRTLIYAVVLLLLPGTLVAEPLQDSARSRESTTRKSLEKTLKQFQERDQKSSGPCAPCQAAIAFAALKLGRYREALEAADKVLAMAEDHRAKVDPFGMAQVYSARGLALARLEPDKVAEIHQALKAAVEAMPLEFDKDRYGLLSNLASSLDRQGDLQAALETLPTPPRSKNPAPPDQSTIRSDSSAQEVTPPRKISTPFPQYSELARLLRLQGSVTLQGIIQTDGRMTDIEILEGIPGLNAQAIRMVETWTFEPARMEGKPVAVYYNLKVNFTLQ